MFEILERSRDNVLGVHASGKLSRADYEELLLPQLEALMKKYEAVCLLCIIDESFEGWEWFALWDDLKVGVKYGGALEKIALVGASSWLEWGAKAGAPLIKGEIRTFSKKEEAQAWEWVESKG